MIFRSGFCWRKRCREVNILILPLTDHSEATTPSRRAGYNRSSSPSSKPLPSNGGTTSRRIRYPLLVIGSSYNLEISSSCEPHKGATIQGRCAPVWHCEDVPYTWYLPSLLSFPPLLSPLPPCHSNQARRQCARYAVFASSVTLSLNVRRLYVQLYMEQTQALRTGFSALRNARMNVMYNEYRQWQYSLKKKKSSYDGELG